MAIALYAASASLTMIESSCTPSVERPFGLMNRSLLVLLLFTMAAKGVAYNFEVEGTLELEIRRIDGNIAQRVSRPFLVSVNRRQWLIRVEFGTNWYTLHGCDGTNTYSILYDDPGKKGGGRPSRISVGTYPADAVAYVRTVWTAFASADFLENMTNAMIAPWSVVGYDPSVKIYRVEVDRSEAIPRLPLNIKFIVSDQLLQSAIRAERKKKNVIRMPDRLKKFTPGFVGGVYSVMSRTNFGGMDIPIEFQLLHYEPWDGRHIVETDATGTPRTVQIGKSYFEKYHGRVITVSGSSREFFLPEIDMDTYTIDSRFVDHERGVSGIEYWNKSKAWLPTNDPMLLKVFQDTIKNKPTFADLDAKRWLILAVLAIMSILPILVLVKYWWKSRAKQTKQT